jgi:hypothetical protein
MPEMARALASGVRWRIGTALAAVSLVVAVPFARASSASEPAAASRPTQAVHASHAPPTVGPGPVRKTIVVAGYRVELSLTPNRVSSNATVAVELAQQGRPVSAARIRLTTMMMTMDMGYTGLLLQTKPGRYVHAWPALGMPGRWRLEYEIVPPGGRRFFVTLLDRVA